MTKRLMDIFVAIIALILLLPIILITAIAVRFFLGSPIIFTQTRPGQYGKAFNMYKFRTMTNSKDNNGNLLPDDKRLPPFGKFLRASSLDELPELYNILKGEMSLVGPRPLLMQYLNRYTDEQMKRHNVKPGITGLAQISGRNSLSWEEKFKLDVKYVETQSFFLDLKILFLTPFRIIKREGITQEGRATADEFMGDN